MDTSDLLILIPPMVGLSAWGMTPLLLRAPGLAVDLPNDRSLHQTPIPRSGGLAIMVPTMVAGWLAAPSLRWILACAVLLALVSFLDDRRPLPPQLRFAVHVIVACLMYLFGPFEWPIMAALLIILGTVWLTNLYNFMDGSDGLAGGMAVIGFGCYALLAGTRGHLELSLVSASISLAALGFLFFNFHPARIFMGDVGSIPMGFLAAALGLVGWHVQAWSPLTPIIVFSPFIADASITLARRLLAGEKFWLPHRNHYYQRLIRMGLGHRRTALYAYLLMLGTAMVAASMVSMTLAVQTGIFAAWLIAYGVLAAMIDRRWQHYMEQRR